MPINEEGRALLIADLRANAAHYDQESFGGQDEDHRTEENSCGTTMCMAGICLLRKVGWEQFRELITRHDRWYNVPREALQAGLEQLSIDADASFIPPIFNLVVFWPEDLRNAFYNAGTQQETVEVAVAALMRLNEDGSIKDEDASASS